MKTAYKSIKRTLSIIIAGSALVLTGCASNATVNESEYSGWLKNDYLLLTQDGEHKGSNNWVHSDERLSQYSKVIIDPVKFHKASDIDFGVPQNVIDESTLYFTDALKKQFSNGYEVVTTPGPDVLRISAAISGAELTKQDIKAYHLIPVSLVVNIAKEAAGARDRVAIVSMEALATDSLTNDKIAMVVQKSAKQTSVQTVEELDVTVLEPTLDFWAVKAKERMDNAHMKSVK